MKISRGLDQRDERRGPRDVKGSERVRTRGGGGAHFKLVSRFVLSAFTAIVLSATEVQCQIFDVVVEPDVPTMTWAQIRAYCPQGWDLCTKNDLCSGTNPRDAAWSTYFGSDDNWVAIRDAENEWVTFSQALYAGGVRQCKTHTQIAGSTPSWGTQTDPWGFYRAGRCCRISREYQNAVAGDHHTCVIADDYTMKCWGGGVGIALVGGQYGETPETTGDALGTVTFANGRYATNMFSGRGTMFVILDDGTIKSWGDSRNGRLGQGATTTPGGSVDFGVNRRVRFIANENFHSCALFDDDTLSCWGGNDVGQLGYGDNTERLAPPTAHVNVGSGVTVRGMGVGWSHTCALLSDGTVKCWGDNARDQLGVNTNSAAATSPSSRVDLGPGSKAVEIAVGSWFNCVILSDRSVKCWGDNTSGQIGAGSAETSFLIPQIVNLGVNRKAKKLSALSSGMCAILDDESVKCWGQAYHGEPGQGSRTDIGKSSSSMGDLLLPISFGTTGATVSSIVTGYHHSCVHLTPGNKLKCWGANGSGRLGIGDTDNRGDDPNEMGDNLPFVNLGTGRRLWDSETPPSPCDASAAPTNGQANDCTSSLASGSTCQPTCDPGYTVSGPSSCTAGTLTAATCAADPCAENERVENNACVACPAGTTNAAGDDASGSDTSCTVCAANYYVSSNTCTACPAGTTNAAGDDASGSDTSCDDDDEDDDDEDAVSGLTNVTRSSVMSLQDVDGDEKTDRLGQSAVAGIASGCVALVAVSIFCAKRNAFRRGVRIARLVQEHQQGRMKTRATQPKIVVVSTTASANPAGVVVSPGLR